MLQALNGEQLFGSFQTIDVKRFFVIALCCVILYVLMTSLIGEKRKADIKDPSSFFSIEQITSSLWMSTIRSFFVGIAAILYVSFALEGGDLVKASKQLILNLLIPMAPKEISGQIHYFFQSIPDWLDPVIILCSFLFVFQTKLRVLCIKTRDLLLQVGGFYSVVNELALSVSHDLIVKHEGDVEAVAASLQQAHSELPLPEEFIGIRGEKRFAYQIIWLLKGQIPEFGVTSTFKKFRAQHNLTAITQDSLRPAVSQLGGATIIFGLLVGFYIMIVPFLHDRMEHSGFAWIERDSNGWSSLITMVLGYTLSFIFPLLFALESYPLRRRAYAKVESEATSFAVVAAAQCVFAFLVRELFNLIDLAIAYVNHDASYTFSTPRVHISALCYSVTPIVAFAVLRQFGQRYRGFLLGLLTSVGASASFFFSDFVYECCMDKFDGYFLHQALLGFYVAAAFYFAVSVTDQMPLPTRPEREP